MLKSGFLHHRVISLCLLLFRSFVRDNCNGRFSSGCGGKLCSFWRSQRSGSCRSQSKIIQSLNDGAPSCCWCFHTRFMEPIVSRLEAALVSTKIRNPRIPVISNVDAQPYSDPETIKKILASQVTSPVKWEMAVKTFLIRGLKKSYELGPGKVIAGIVKRMDKGEDTENISA